MHRFFTYSLQNHYFEYSWYNLELLRLLGSAPHGGVDAAEFLETIDRIKPNDASSWKRNWTETAEKTYDLANSMLSKGHTAAARGAFLRASNYFRCAQYLWPIATDEEQAFHLMLYHQSKRCFENAAVLMDHPVQKVEIRHHVDKTNAVMMPGYLHLPPENRKFQDRKTPVMICIGGADSTQEELYFLSVAQGPDLGYAVLTFDGPGQGLALREEGVHLQPEGEKLIDSVLGFLVSFAQTYPEANLDTEAFVVTGQSLGGYLALRASTDSRIKACVAVDSFYDMWDMAMARMPKMITNFWEQGYIRDGFINWMATTHGKSDVCTKYQFAIGQKMFGTPDAATTLREMKRYTFKLPGQDDHDFLENVKCPVLVTGAGADRTFLPEFSTQAIMNGLKNVKESEKEVWVPMLYADGGAQAKSGAWPLLQHRTFAFLDQKLGIHRLGADPEATELRKNSF